jgi:uncharacterized protein YjiS (DUF1127 family)
MNLSNYSYLISRDGQKTARDIGPWLSPTLARLHRAVASWAGRLTRVRELGELYRFSDRELWDIGLSRSDIMSIERGTYRRD